MKTFITAVIGLLFLFGGTPAWAASVPKDPREKYAAGQGVKILIVPGHDDEFSGALYDGVKESDLNLQVAEKLSRELAQETTAMVTLSRTKDGYLPELERYFSRNTKDIERFIEKNKRATHRAITNGTIEVGEQVPHSDAPSEVAYRLYAINKWAGEKGFDLVIHIHFNDFYPQSFVKERGMGGYAVYTPEHLPNADGARPLADSIGARLGKSLYPSDVPTEAKKIDAHGVIPDFKLIALGSNQTLTIPSVLIEYSYIYEPVAAPWYLGTTSSLFARATALGIREYLTGQTVATNNMQYSFDGVLHESRGVSLDVLMLQMALKEIGYFPPTHSVRAECALDGVFGVCTKTAVAQFQKDHGLKNDGIAGPQTLQSISRLLTKAR